MKFLLTIVLLLLISLPGYTQKKVRPAPTKPVIRATVTVKGDGNAPPVYSEETDAGVWNEFASKDGRVHVLLPARTSDVEWLYEDVRGVEAGFLTARSKSARYQIVTRPS